MALPALAMRVWLIVKWEWFWHDEAFSAIVARLPLARLIAATAGDVHPPLYYLLLAGWLRLTSFLPLETAARSLSLLLSLLALFLYWRLLSRLGITGAQAGMAWLLAAYLPGLIFFASEARMYALLEVEVLGALLVLLPPHLDERLSLKRIVAGGSILGATALTHNAGLYYCATVVVAVLLLRWQSGQGLRRSITNNRRLLAEMTGIGGVAALVWAPWLPAFLGQLRNTNSGYWIWNNGLATVVYMLFQAVFYTRLGGKLDWLSAPAMFLMVGLSLAGIWMERRRWGLLALAFGPMIIGMATSYILGGTGALLHRTLIPSTFFLVILWARPLAQSTDTGRLLRALVIIVLIVCCGTFVRGRAMISYDFLDRYIHPQAGDIMYSSSMGMPLVLYSNLPLYFAPSSNRIGNGLTIQTQEALGLQVVWLDELPESAWRRAWLIYAWTPADRRDVLERITAMVERYHGELIFTVEEEKIATCTIWLLHNHSSDARSSTATERKE
jgi:hypothetical protein